MTRSNTHWIHKNRKKTSGNPGVFFNLLWFLYLVSIIGCTDDNGNKAMRGDNLFEKVDSNHSKILFQNDIVDYPNMHLNIYDYYYNGGGVAIGDINNDGLSDILFTGNNVANKLYLNKGDMQFEDISEFAGIGDKEFWSTGVNFIDINNDGWLDIYICHSGYSGVYLDKRNHLYINMKDNSFQESSEKFNLQDQSYSNQSVFFDSNKDGLIDLFLANNTDFTNRFKGTRSFTKLYSKIENYSNSPSFDKELSNKFYQNKGQQFEQKTASVNLDDWGYGLGIKASDIEKDGDVDLYVSNDYWKPDFFYINKNGVFTNENKSRLGHNSQFSMGLDIADFNNDSWPDIAVVDMVAPDRLRNKTLMAPMNEGKFLFLTEKLNNQEQFMFNMFQMNNGNGTFSDIGQLLNLTQTDWSWASLFADFNMDGRKDYFVTNGFLKDTKNRDLAIETRQIVQEKLNNDQENKPVENLSKFPSTPLRNYLFQNHGNFNFENVSEEWGFHDKSFSNGAAYGDLDNDGDLDIVINNINSEAFLYRNLSVEKGSYNYLNFKIGHNPQNLNTKFTLYTKDAEQYIEYHPTRGYLSCMENLVHFGLENTTTVDSVKIEWIYGNTLTLYNIKVNQVIPIDISMAQDNKTISQDTKKSSATKTRLFTEVSVDLPTHKENNFWDFKTEVLLPHKQSSHGPHISVADVNNDQLDDFFVGGAKGQRASIYLQNKSGSFTGTPVFASGYEDIGSVFFDYDKDGDKDLYVVSGGGGDVNQHSPETQDRLYNNDGAGNFTLAKGMLPVIRSSGSRVKEADFDNDGDLDLFVGGRVTPGNYPQAPNSLLLRNDGNRFINVINQLSPDLQKIGMVTDFSWCDLNNDDLLDLVLVGEWMRVEIFIQSDGKFVNRTDDYFSQDTRGWWFSIAAKDMDNDGDLDLITGNLGLNNKFHASKEHPLDIFFNDFDENGTGDIVLAKTDKEGEQYALRGKDCSTQQMPFIKDKFPKYEEFALASLKDVYSEEKLDKSLHYSITDFSSVYFENKNGTFVKHTLPRHAQAAPIQDILIEDFDEDSHLDIIVAGNLFTTEIETASYDAGTGLFLKGNGTANFTAIPTFESGFFVNKDVRDLAKITVNGKKCILVGNNNDKVQLIEINQ